MVELKNDKHLTQEWEQAWNHYRHLETSRNQYLGFYFTILVASVSVAIGLLKDASAGDKTTIIFGILILAFIVYLITITLFTAVKKSGYILKRYEIIISSIRKKSNYESSEVFPFDLSDMQGYPKEVLDSGLFSVQRSAEIILAVGSILLSILVIVIAAFINGSNLVFEGWHKGLGVTIALCTIVYLIAVFGPLLFRVNRESDKKSG